MTSGKEVLKDAAKVQASIEKEEKKALEEIRWREHNSESEIVRKAIIEYIKAHMEGNETFKLEKWNEDPGFKAVPTISARSEIWYNYLTECTEKDRLQIQIQANHINQQCKNIKGVK